MIAFLWTKYPAEVSLLFCYGGLLARLPAHGSIGPAIEYSLDEFVNCM